MRMAGAHRYALRIYFEDTDAGGIVYHANYLRFAERARTEALRDAGIPHAELVKRFNLMFVVRSVELDYAAPARLDDSLIVLTAPLRVGGASVRLRQEIRRVGDEQTLGTADFRLGCVRPGEARPMLLPARWREGLQAMGVNGS